MTIHPHPQGSEEWHEARRAKITGTRASILFNRSPAIFKKILVEYTGDELKPVRITDSMIAGKEKEPLARKQLSKISGFEFVEFGFCFDESLPILGLSPDGFSADLKDGCEIKCFEAEEHLEVCLTKEIPKKNIDQCVQYFIVNEKLERLWFCAYRPEQPLRPLFYKIITRESLIDIGLTETIEIEQFGVKGQKIKPKTKVVKKLVTVTQAVEIARKEAISINKQLNEAVDKLKF